MERGVNFELELAECRPTSIRVFGVGGAGGNAVDHMVAAQVPGVKFIAANTDAQVLAGSRAGVKLQLGERLTRGQGAGGDPAVGRAAAEESADLIREMLDGAEMVFLTAGMGGGTGTGAAPVVARVARELGALTVAVVTRPFAFEGRRRAEQALHGLGSLKEEVDTLIVIPNQRLLAVVKPGTPVIEAFRVADDVLLQAVRGIAGLVTGVGYINLDFKDVQAVMRGKGNAIMGIGVGAGANRATVAATAAISSPLLEDVSIAGAHGILINITGGSDLALDEIDQAASVVASAAGGDAEVYFGAVLADEPREEIEVTVIATGFGESERDARYDRASSYERFEQKTRTLVTPHPGDGRRDEEDLTDDVLRRPAVHRRAGARPPEEEMAYADEDDANGANGAGGRWPWKRNNFTKAERNEVPAYYRKRAV